MIGDRLQQIRKKAGMTQFEFSAANDIPNTTYKNYERNLTGPPVALLRQISENFSIDFLWLATGMGAPAKDGLFHAIEEASTLVRSLCKSLPAEPEPAQEAKIVALLVKQWMETGAASSETAKFLIERAA